MFKKSICQILILVFFFFYNFSNSAFGKTLNLCEGNFDMLPYEVISDLRPNLIEIEVDKYRNWQKNNLKIHTSDNPNILQKFKKKFNSKIIVHFDQKVKCNFKAKIRQSGDHKDHIKFLNGNFFQSVDVELDSGNIKKVNNLKFNFFFLILSAPCQSISNNTFFPFFKFRTTNFLEVPYKFLNTLACSRNSLFFISFLNFFSFTK